MRAPRLRPPAAACALALAGLLATAGACRKGDSTAEAATSESAAEDGGKAKEEAKGKPVPVEVTSLERGPIEAVLRYSTNLIALEQVEVHAQAARLVRAILVEEGDQVVLDRPLLRLQDDDQRSALAKAQAQYDRAEREHRRMQGLAERQLVSEQAFSDSTFDFEQKRIALDDARRELGYTEVRAPIAGTITRRLVAVGDQISVGQHLFDVVDFDSLVAPVFVPEKELRSLGVGQTARLQAQAAGDQAFAGHIDRIAPIVDPKSGTVKVTVAIDGHGGLRPGMYVDVALVTARHEQAVLVPKRTLVYDKDQVFVYRLGKARRVEKVAIVPLLADRDSVEPVAGLSEGDQLVIAGQAGLKDGALVRLPGDPEPEGDDEAGDGGEDDAGAA